MDISKLIEEVSQERTIFKSFYAWYDALSEQDRQDLDTALLSPEVSNVKLFRALKSTGGISWGNNAMYYHVETLRKGLK